MTRLNNDAFPPTIPARLQEDFTLAMETSAIPYISDTMEPKIACFLRYGLLNTASSFKSKNSQQRGVHSGLAQSWLRCRTIQEQ